MVRPAELPWRTHYRLFFAIGIIILSPFQYGIDFGMIGGLQAMVPFLQVSISLPTWNYGKQECIRSMDINAQDQSALLDGTFNQTASS